MCKVENSTAYSLDEFLLFFIEQFSVVWLFFILYFRSIFWWYVWKRLVLVFGSNWAVEVLNRGFDVS